MNMQKYCPKGHAYDSSLPACPFCLPAQGGAGQSVGYHSGNLGPTAPANNQGGNIGATAPANNNQFGGNYQGGNVGPTAPANPPPSQQETTFIGDLSDPNNPTPKVEPTPRVRPVVGWLVCVRGVDVGKDFRLHTDFNHVGRAENQDVILSDATVSREHFIVSYDRINNRYYAEMGRVSSNTSMVYINGYSLGGRTLLKKGDQIQVGDTLLVFIPLEQQDVKWNWRV